MRVSPRGLMFILSNANKVFYIRSRVCVLNYNAGHAAAAIIVNWNEFINRPNVNSSFWTFRAVGIRVCIFFARREKKEEVKR